MPTDDVHNPCVKPVCGICGKRDNTIRSSGHRLHHRPVGLTSGCTGTGTGTGTGRAKAKGIGTIPVGSPATPPTNATGQCHRPAPHMPCGDFHITPYSRRHCRNTLQFPDETSIIAAFGGSAVDPARQQARGPYETRDQGDSQRLFAGPHDQSGGGAGGRIFLTLRSRAISTAAS
jgi:hypothetical protein